MANRSLQRILSLRFHSRGEGHRSSRDQDQIELRRRDELATLRNVIGWRNLPWLRRSYWSDSVIDAPKPTAPICRNSVRTIVAWPEAMRRKTAAQYLDTSEAAFEREVFAGRMPPPFRFGGKALWRKASIDRALDVITGDAAVKGEDAPWRLETRERHARLAAEKRQREGGRRPQSLG